jgi:hypothetical protein
MIRKIFRCSIVVLIIQPSKKDIVVRAIICIPYANSN